ncbi:flagellar M-ring protein FliF [Aquibacillus koreensis]|uniref:Flagellar M-ring protein n=1 Tax=Aquibacillus koreensis TaxID=279446 RepID=A0A9X3WKP7_9BACI|nr:flagellar basal-body MS-ring/collar protein FliF [Aquibacillus koreensis]MCT2534519.1 flagellar basal-body MS-ring/collar protein FliF [Aquibacillus koreensis]MDC3421887.1 flagellar M-ring protein FliF [Aquibacillus koreensis]
MKQRFDLYREKIKNYWTTRSKAQKGLFIGLIFLFLLLIVGGSFLTNHAKMVPLYSNLSLQEVGQIKAELDARGVKYELSNAGTTLSVPSEQVDTLLVDLAAQGLPDSGNVDYSFFSQNASWGMTDNEFEVMKLDAMQTELANLIKSINGIQDASVMLNKPQTPVFLSDREEEASASIVIETQPGYQINESQIKALYHLVSKTVPNLPTDNIVIMNQNFEYFDLNNSNSFASGDAYASQQAIKRDVERDLQRRIQQMIGTMIGNDKVIASVTADIDFTQENRIEEIVEPVDEENMQGLPVSVERVTEAYTGTGAEAAEGGVGDGDVPNYPAADENGTGDYEMVKESINNEFNRIQREIVESKYKIRDLGIQVAVDNTKEPVEEANEVQYLTQQEQMQVEEGIASILDSIVTTSIDKSYGDVVPDEKVSIVFQEFNGRQSAAAPTVPIIPFWTYVIGGLLILAIIGLIIALRKRKKSETIEEEFALEETPNVVMNDVPDIDNKQETETGIKKKQLERMAQQKPEDFAKLIRSWIADD